MSKQFVRNRKQFVRIADTHSETLTINIGVPQGSVLGPLLFLLYINDLHFSIKHSKTRYFADDTCLLLTSNSLKQLKKHMNQDLKHLCKWLLANKISLNKEKTEAILFRHPNKNINYDLKLKLDGKKLQLTNFVKYLGVYLDSNLNWSKHVDTIAPKLSRAVGMLAKIRHYVSTDTLRNIYFAIFHSILTYGAQVWGQNENKNLKRLLLIQKRALRVINFAEYNSSTSQLFFDSKIMKLDDHVTIQNYLLAHDFINHNLPPPLISLFQHAQLQDNPQPSVTRTISTTPVAAKLLLPKARTQAGLNSTIYRSCATWNYLTTLYFPNTDTDQPYKSPCTLSKFTCKKTLNKKLSEKYIQIEDVE